MAQRANAKTRSISKFDSRLTELVYQLSLDGGADEEAGDANELGWAGIMRGGKSLVKALRDDPEYYDLDDEDEEELSDLDMLAGVILYNDSAGFVSSDEFESADDLEEHWEKVVEDLEPDDEDEDDD